MKCLKGDEVSLTGMPKKSRVRFHSHQNFSVSLSTEADGDFV